MTENNRPKRRHGRRRMKNITYMYIAFVLGVSMLLSAWIIMSANEVLALSRPDFEAIVSIPEDASRGDVAKILKDENIIEHKMLFRLFAFITKRGSEFPPGEYKLNSNLDYRAMLRRLTSKKGKLNTATVTIPEGYETEQIANLLADKGICEKDAFYEAITSTDFEFDFLDGLPIGKQSRLEGYLFPDTYEFYLNDDPARVIKKFLSNFELKYNEGMQERAKALGMTTHELITLASIIEREATAQDRDTISSVFHNRLSSKTYPYLESCATVQYVLGERKKVISIADTKIDNPYNTYRYKGLPPGPIANPGVDSIEAALYPKDTNFLFFALQEDGTHKFSKTYEEHLKTPKLNP